MKLRQCANAAPMLRQSLKAIGARQCANAPMAGGCGGRESAHAFLPLFPRAYARVGQARLACNSRNGRLPAWTACLRALMTGGAWLLLVEDRAEGASAGTRANARLRTHAHENPPADPREASHVR